MGKISAMVTFDLSGEAPNLYTKVSKDLEKIGIEKYYMSGAGKTKLPNNTYLYVGESQDPKALKLYLHNKMKEIFKKYKIGAKYSLFIASDLERKFSE